VTGNKEEFICQYVKRIWEILLTHILLSNEKVNRIAMRIADIDLVKTHNEVIPCQEKNEEGKIIGYIANIILYCEAKRFVESLKLRNEKNIDFAGDGLVFIF
jgi:hypothetical protein